MKHIRSLLNLFVRVRAVRILLAALLMGFGSVFASVWPLLILGIAFFVSVVRSALSTRQVVVDGYLIGLGSSLLILSPFALGVLPLDWYGLRGWVLPSLALSVSALLAAHILVLPYVIMAWVIRRFYSYTWIDLVSIPAAWVVCLWLSSWFFYIVFHGAGSFVGPHFTLGFLGYPLASNPILLQLASIGGIYLLSFSTVLFGVLVCKAFIPSRDQHKYSYKLILIGIILVVGILQVLFIQGRIFQPSQDTPLITVAAISRYVPPVLAPSHTLQTQHFTQLRDVILPLRTVDLIVFPENSGFLQMAQSDGFNMLQFAQAGKSGQIPAMIDATDGRDQEGNMYAEANLFKNGHINSIGQKQFLLPFGEYIPYAFDFLFSNIGENKLLTSIRKVRSYTPGENTQFARINETNVAVRFCDEILSPSLFLRQTTQGAHVLVNLSALSWFHGSHVVYENMHRVAQVRAVENGRYLVQSTNMAPAFILDQYGRVVSETRWDELGVAKADVPSLRHTTLFVRLGEWYILWYALCAFCILLYIRRVKRVSH